MAFLAEALKALDETIPAAKLLAWLRDRSELLVERNANQYEFSHRSFQSYLAAAEIGQRGKEEWLLDQWDQSQSANQDDEKQKDWWHETIILYVAQQDNPNRAIQGLIQRGAAMLAYKCWQETSKQIKPELRAELEPLANQVQDSLYDDLERYLRQQEWRKADEETYQVMIAVLGKEKGDWFTEEELRTFPCEDLLRVDRLWREASNDHFGFSAQKAVWEECGSPMDYNSDWERFGDRVGWRKDGDWLAYNDVKFDTTAPHAHLPVGVLLGVVVGGLAVWGGFVCGGGGVLLA
ncbi:MAG: hypothetical protein F6K30_08415 [Cyanothece sp. SIO2G6]|nr:hypothetical protein [Cyanothece sp. SIO2G6]